MPTPSSTRTNAEQPLTKILPNSTTTKTITNNNKTLIQTPFDAALGVHGYVAPSAIVSLTLTLIGPAVGVPGRFVRRSGPGLAPTPRPVLQAWPPPLAQCSRPAMVQPVVCSAKNIGPWDTGTQGTEQALVAQTHIACIGCSFSEGNRCELWD